MYLPNFPKYTPMFLEIVIKYHWYANGDEASHWGILVKLLINLEPHGIFWYILINFCLFIHFDIAWPLEWKMGTKLCKKFRPQPLPPLQLPQPPPQLILDKPQASKYLKIGTCHASQKILENIGKKLIFTRNIKIFTCPVAWDTRKYERTSAIFEPWALTDTDYLSIYSSKISTVPV